MDNNKSCIEHGIWMSACEYLLHQDAVRRHGGKYLIARGLAKYFPTMNIKHFIFFVRVEEAL